MSESAFEALAEDDGPFGLVVAAQCFHALTGYDRHHDKPGHRVSPPPSKQEIQK